MAGADPTVFTHALHLLPPPPPHSQENRPKGTSVLQLSVSDQDATHNGPPFHFAIVDGNEGDAFEISQQGALVAVGPLNKKGREHYLLQAQVSLALFERKALFRSIDPSSGGSIYPAGSAHCSPVTLAHRLRSLTLSLCLSLCPSLCLFTYHFSP